MIEVEHLTKRYADLVAVDDISFKVQKGEILGFLGPNGAGKTTTMRVLTCALPPSTGTVHVAGFDVQRESMEVRRSIGYLPEIIPLYPEMRVRSYLDFVAKIKEIPKSEREERVDTILERCWLTQVEERLIKQLSKGFRQRLGLAQALIHNPQVLVLDEPTSGLDPKQIIETRELIKSLAGDHTIILSTHILPEVAMTCQRVVIINQGRVVAEDTPLGLTARLMQGAERVVLQVRGPRAEVLDHVTAVTGVLRVDARGPGPEPDVVTLEIESQAHGRVREEVAATIIGRGWGLLELRPVGMSLEDIFLKLTTEEPETEQESEILPPGGPLETGNISPVETSLAPSSVATAADIIEVAPQETESRSPTTDPRPPALDRGGEG